LVSVRSRALATIESSARPLSLFAFDHNDSVIAVRISAGICFVCFGVGFANIAAVVRSSGQDDLEGVCR
jgi:hypothetical protein